MFDVSEVEKRIDHAIAAPIEVNADIGGITLKDMGQVMEFAKMMAVSGSAVPVYLRGNPGGCLAICSRALRWGMDPFAVAEKSYLMKNPKSGEERIAYESQIIHAVVTARAPLKQRLRSEIIGTGDERICRVWGTFKGEDTPHEYKSPTLKVMKENRPKRRDGEGYGGSPLWDSIPEVQLTYSTVRQWCRLHASEVLLGVYSKDELEDSGSEMKDVTPAKEVPLDALVKRLKEAQKAHGGRRFDAASVLKTIDGNEPEEVNSADRNDDAVEGRQPDAGDREVHTDDAGGDAGGINQDAGAGKADARSQAATVKGEGEALPADDGPPKPKGKGKR